MSEVIADPASSKAHRYLAEICDRAVKTFAEVKQWRDKPVPIRKVDKLFDAVAALVNHVALGWDPRKDASIQGCIDELKTMITRTTGEKNPQAKVEQNVKSALEQPCNKDRE
ncbi:hypothetical protein PPTG_22533 [Phytophthora nicotianae INRA-310]|uniref:Uncharacterized protein n=1 Tax=Phytophthora nicotianae (strain INRA-310) TaxID=761204 RepID=W2QGW6_PHYN3|nr:hypothetical protein PPTG_22533 [Phytophthora nicotianae INRA-310]ETN11754.1 hypothetical protein PPTG_22533 [Phytophthora nicotianae INRA-310]